MIEFRNISFSYENGDESGQLKNINLKIPSGQVVLLCGTSGCGKTTLTRLINGLIPNYYEGNLKGTVFINGKNISKEPLYETAAIVGSVFQNPRSQFFAVDTTSELAFGCENLGLSKEDIMKRMKMIVSNLKLQSLMNRSIFALSGGEKQKIACGSSAMIEPDIFVLDEPSSNLDIPSIRELSKVIALWKEQGKTIIIAEHRLSYLVNLVDRVLYMDEGEIKYDFSADEFCSIPADKIQAMGLRSLHTVHFTPAKDGYKETGEKLKFAHFNFNYDNVSALNIDEISLPRNAIIGIVGSNGAGKSTFARCICGLEKNTGMLTFDNQTFRYKERLNECYMVMQNPSHQLFTEDVFDEVLLSMDKEDDGNIAAAEEILSSLNLVPFKERHPMSLSGGQQQRVAIASAVASKRKLLIFDEPTSGLDYRDMLEVAKILKDLRDMGKTILLITHDPELIDCCCDYFVFMEKGAVAWNGALTSENIQKLESFFDLGQ